MGFSLIAEKNYLRLMEFPEYESIACKQLGFIFQEQEQMDKAIEYFKRSLEIEAHPKTA